MDSEDQPIEVIDENSRSNTFNEAWLQMQNYKSFVRPEIQINSEHDDLNIMGIDVTSAIKVIYQKNRKVNKPFIRIFGANQVGNSFQIIVSDFIPYFYTSLPRNFDPDSAESQRYREELRLGINKLFVQLETQKHKKQYFQSRVIEEEAILSIEVVRRVNIRKYVSAKDMKEMKQHRYFKINTSTPNVVSPLRNIFEKQFRVQNVVLPKQTFQSNIPYALRFMVDKDIVGMGWFRISKGEYKIRSKEMKDSVCQVQVQCSVSAIQTLDCISDQWAKIAPMRILSFDIECAAQHGFPNAQTHQIIQIACVCKTTTQKEDDYKVVFALNGSSSISGVHIKQSPDQRFLLEEFQKLILSYDPDFILGYNMINFDLSYMLERAAVLKMKNYGTFGRSLSLKSKIKKGSFQSKQMGNRDTKEINIDGRIQLDLMLHMHRQHKLSSYTLNNVSYHFLREQKEDVHHSEIYKLFKESRETRKRLAIYCLKDAQLPLKLMEKLCCLYNYAEMARVTGVPINFLLNRGQQIKVVSQILRKAKQHGYILPTSYVNRNSDEKGFDGAYVLDPVTGFYQEPIATLDFASLYPSIMMAHNLCYTTLIPAYEFDRLIQNGELGEKDFIKTPQGFYFVLNTQKTQKKGLLPEILFELLTARKKAKQQLKKTTDQMMRNVLDGRQLALKISANSVYGFTGATVGQLPCLQISSSVTAFGRQMIDKTRNKVLELYPGSEVVYGDTDSVMVKFKLYESVNASKRDQIAESMKFGREAAERISNQLFERPIKLQFEKVYCPFLLMAKKRYVGVYYTNPDKYDKIDKKGFQSVRRDNCYLIREMLDNILDFLLVKKDKEGIATYVKQIISDLVQNKIDISKLVITKAISKNTQEDDDEKTQKTGKDTGKSVKNTYKVKQAHVELAQKMRKRDENITLGVGDRISYVMVAGQKGSRNYQNAEDPIKVLNQDVPLDYDYYIQKQIRPPLQRLLQKTDVIPNLDALFVGEHTKNRYIPKVNINSMLGKFIKIAQSCINCPTQSNKPLCDRCEPKYLQIYLQKQAQFESFKMSFQELWRECQNCQGSITMQILCSNFDCPIFYKRIKVKNDLNSKRANLQKLNTLALQF